VPTTAVLASSGDDRAADTQLLRIDIDAHGEIERAAASRGAFCKTVPSTYKSAPESPRCRVVVLLADLCTDLRAYEKAHDAPGERLCSSGYVRPNDDRGIKGEIDEGASDATRLSCAPMHRPRRGFRFLASEGDLLDLNRIPEPPRPAPRPGSPALRYRNPDRHREAALRRAEEQVRGSLEGQRHEALFKEAASLT
jgi:hypothetical protein